MKLSGFVDLIEVDVKMYVKNWSDQKKDHFGPKKDQKGPKMRFLNFELEEKLDHHFQVKFDGESDGDSLRPLKPYFDPLIGPY